MSLVIDPVDKELAMRLLVSCGGTFGPMMKAVELLDCDDSNDYYTALGVMVERIEALEELAETARQTTGKIDRESLLLHFSGQSHTDKFDTVSTTVGAELPRESQAFAHTLVPLTLVSGRYYYDNGCANVEIRGLVPLGAQKGTPYAHLASLIWVEDSGLSSRILANQEDGGLPLRVEGVSLINYEEAPLLRKATLTAKEAFGM